MASARTLGVSLRPSASCAGQHATGATAFRRPVESLRASPLPWWSPARLTVCRAVGPTKSEPPVDLKEPKPPPVPATNWGKTSDDSSGGVDGGDGGNEEETWGFTDLRRFSHRWDVPWNGPTTAGGIFLWLLSFVGTGFLVVPELYRQAGLDMFSLDSSGKASFTLITQICETVVTLALIRLLTYRQLDTAPEGTAEDVFNYSPAEPFKKPYGWAVWAGIGVVLSPFVVGTTAYLMSQLGYDEAVAGGRGTADGVAAMISMDLPTYASLVSVTGLLAPILEETVFRGFLLTSLTKYMPTWGAVILSSFAFGLAHLSPRDFPVLVVLGCLLGFSYTRSRNLLTPIIIHGVWNSSVITFLFYLASSGIDIEAMLKEAR